MQLLAKFFSRGVRMAVIADRYLGHLAESTFSF
jgi:hypothetical protein